MIEVQVKILAKDDPGPAVPDAIGAKVLELTDLVVLEAGTTNGKTSVAMVLRDVAGKPYIVQTSANIFDMLAGAVKGASLRFGEKL